MSDLEDFKLGGRHNSGDPEGRRMVTRRLVLDFPLRPNYIAQIVIPSDLTTDEAKRLQDFLLALAIPKAGE